MTLIKNTLKKSVMTHTRSMLIIILFHFILFRKVILSNFITCPNSYHQWHFVLYSFHDPLRHHHCLRRIRPGRPHSYRSHSGLRTRSRAFISGLGCYRIGSRRWDRQGGGVRAAMWTFRGWARDLRGLQLFSYLDRFLMRNLQHYSLCGQLVLNCYSNSRCWRLQSFWIRNLFWAFEVLSHCCTCSHHPHYPTHYSCACCFQFSQQCFWTVKSMSLVCPWYHKHSPITPVMLAHRKLHLFQYYVFWHQIIFFSSLHYPYFNFCRVCQLFGRYQFLYFRIQYFYSNQCDHPSSIVLLLLI